jgi:neutral ceramidase
MDGDVSEPLWKAGAASVKITPTEPMWLAGWAARRQPASSAAMDLFVKALAVEDWRGERLVIVTADLIAIPRALAEAVARQALNRWSLSRDRLLFNASHTHSGPEVRPDKVPFFEIPGEFAEKIEPYVQGLEKKILGAVDAALTKLEPVTIRAFESNVSFAQNRRTPDGPTDHSVPVLTFTNREDKLTAIVFGYACHNLTLPPTFHQYHGDYAGVAQKLIESSHARAIALFLSGAGADQDPSPRGTPELCEIHGRALAEAIDKDFVGRGNVIEGRLRVAFEQVELPLQPAPSVETLQTDVRSDDQPRSRKARFLLEQLAQQRPLPTGVRCPVQVVRFGKQLLLIALGGEPVIDYAREIKARFPDELVWVAGYSNDMFGYLPSHRVLKEGGYEGGRATLWSALPSPLDETAEKRVLDAVVRLAGNTL